MDRRFTAEVRFSFPTVLSLLLCTDREGTALLCLISCVLHELGHILIMLRERKPPRKITFYGGGILLSGGGTNSTAALLAGCVMNFLLAGFFSAFPETRLFGAVNLLTGLLNLLPVRPLDGGLLCERAYLRLFPVERVERLMRATETAAAALLAPTAVLMFFNGTVSVSAVIFIAYLAAAEIFEAG